MRLTKTYGKLVINTLINILPQVTNILTLLVLFIFIYAVLGISLFSTVRYYEDYNDYYHFRNVFAAMVLLFRCATGEDW